MQSNEKTNVMDIRTPEGVFFPIQLAGPVTRCSAWLIDLACILGIQNIIMQPVRIFGIINPDFAAAFGIIMYFFIGISYGIILEWIWDGKTLGKKILSIRVRDKEGLKLAFPQIVIRNLMRTIDLMPFFYMIGGISSLLSRHYQRLGDFAAETVVVRELKISEPDLSLIMPEKYNSFRDYPNVAVRARNTVTPEEAAIIQNALLRKKQLSEEARSEVYAELAGYFKKIVDFPQEASDGLSDENYLRNLAEIVFKKSFR